MKKLSVLVALILCVTIGGVYATWNYAQGTVTTRTKFFDAGTIITDKVVTTDKGNITIDTTSLKITIHDENNDLHGEMKAEGYVTVTFTPNQGADSAVAANGVKLQYVLGTTNNYTYEGTAIFAVNTTAQDLGLVNGSVNIPASELDALIDLNALYLPTAEDYDAFKLALHSGAISITVSEAPATP